MKRSGFMDSQILALLKQASGMPVKEIYRKAGISEPTCNVCKSKSGGMKTSDLKHTMELETDLVTLSTVIAAPFAFCYNAAGICAGMMGNVNTFCGSD